jgi:allantoicase
VVPDPRFLGGTVDVAAMENGGRLVATSDAFYSSPANLIRPGRARIMGEGWENARRRDDGNDFATFQLTARTRLREIELDTSYFVGNAPGAAQVTAVDGSVDDPSSWWVAVPRTRLQPDTRHRFLVQSDALATHVRLDVYPDGGLARFRCLGEIPRDELAVLRERWWNALPAEHRETLGSPPS